MLNRRSSTFDASAHDFHPCHRERKRKHPVDLQPSASSISTAASSHQTASPLRATSLITAYSAANHLDAARQIYNHTRFLLCFRVVHAHILASGFKPHARMLNRLIDLYSKAGYLHFSQPPSSDAKAEPQHCVAPPPSPRHCAFPSLPSSLSAVSSPHHHRLRPTSASSHRHHPLLLHLSPAASIAVHFCQATSPELPCHPLLPASSHCCTMPDSSPFPPHHCLIKD